MAQVFNCIAASHVHNNIILLLTVADCLVLVVKYIIPVLINTHAFYLSSRVDSIGTWFWCSNDFCITCEITKLTVTITCLHS